jgi:transcriptional antiterminator RfaH
MKMLDNGAGIGGAALQNGSATLRCPSFPRFLMTYSRSELAAIDIPLWFCLRTQPKHEHLAATALRRQFEIRCFSPRLRFRKATRRGAVWFVEPMFPGYLFAEFLYSSMHRAVEHASGVHGIVHFGDYLATIKPEVVAALQERAGDEEVVTIDPEIKQGQSVHIAEGPFQGLEAVVTQVLSAGERVKVLLEFLGRSVETEISMPKVLPAKR